MNPAPPPTRATRAATRTPVSAAPLTRRPPVLRAGAAAVLLAAGVAAAAGDPGPVPPGRPAATAAAPAAARGAAPEAAGAALAAPDPMAQLRQRLAERLAGPRSAGDDNLRVVVQPASPAAVPPAAAPAVAAGPAAPARPVAPRPPGSPAGPLKPVSVRVSTAPLQLVEPAGPPAPPPPDAAQAAAAPALAPATAAALRQADVVLTTAHRPSGVVATRSPRRAPSGSPAAHGTGDPHSLWGYLGPAGPQAWGALRPEFTLCSKGQRQSPIDIRGGLAVDLEPVRFEYQPSGFSVIDNGHTVQANLAPGNALLVGGKRFELKQLHFHRPSEERIDGRQFEMSVHLVHQDDQGKLAVVAILLDKGPPQPAVQLVWNNLPLEKHEEVPARVPLDLNVLLPTDARYYTYMGSLTTPPCSEGVQWVVMRQPVTVAPEQIDIFSRIYPMNARPVQQASGRRILQSQ